jgi:hypothetical protein
MGRDCALQALKNAAKIDPIEKAFKINDFEGFYLSCGPAGIHT